MKNLTVQEYMELVGSEGLLKKSMAGELMNLDGTGSEKIIPEEEDDEETDDEEEEDGDADSDGEGLDDAGETEFTLTISTSDEDRLQDILDPLGCVTDNFQNNPLFLYEHGGAPANGMFNPDAILGQIKSLTLTDTGVQAHARYIPRAGNALANRILDMERKGLIPANSMGWLPLGDIKLLDNGTRKVGKWELIEVSKVVIPANGRATNRRIGS